MAPENQPASSSRAALGLMLFALWAPLTGCNDDPPITPEPSEPKSGYADAAVKEASTSDAKVEELPPHTCPTDLPGPPMIGVRTANGDGYCIDATEVTQGQYHEFLKAKGADPMQPTQGDTSGQSPECSENDWLYIPWHAEGHPCFAFPIGFDPRNEHADYPVTCVDWCDARAYCEWAGKRLCGRVGGGDATASLHADANVSEWYNACSQGGKTAFPYGDTYEPGTCFDTAAYDAAIASGLTHEQASKGESNTCHGSLAGFEQLRQMSGSVGEWAHECGRLGQPICLIRGGFRFYEPEEQKLRCDAYIPQTPDTSDVRVGIRCCK